MLLFKKHHGLFCALVFTSIMGACGFQPMYQQTDTATTNRIMHDLSNVTIANIPDRDGQYLRNQLIDRLYVNGTPDDSNYTLEINDLDKDIVNMGLRKDAVYTRGEMRIQADLVLTDKRTNTVVLKRRIRTVGGFNLLDNQFATLTSEESLTDHLLQELSDDVVNEMRLYFNRMHLDQE